LAAELYHDDNADFKQMRCVSSRRSGASSPTGIGTQLRGSVTLPQVGLVQSI